MAHRIKKNNVGVYKEELRNEPLKFLVTPDEELLINSQCQEYKNRSEYLRVLILIKRKRRVKKDKQQTSLTKVITKLGRQLNSITKKVNISLLNNEMINFNDKNELFSQIINALDKVKDRIKTINKEKKQKRNIQIKLLVTPTELKQIKIKLKRTKIFFCTYIRQQITGYEEKEFKNKAIEISRGIGRLANNINQLINAIRIQKRTKGIALIDKTTEQSIIIISQSIKELQLQLK